MNRKSHRNIPDHLQRYVCELVAQGSYKTEQDVIVAALEAQLAATKRLEQELEAGLAGPAVEFTEELLAQLTERALKRASAIQPTAS